ncbi:YqfQ family protein [Bacillus piscicola]|uniref:YqfQ family protein n=1 Tax=Bacillus piscicola TaxID=1632684 RepID=UPI001F09F1C0|nr:YqfQ family protein [Bacillus piscicola]
MFPYQPYPTPPPPFPAHVAGNVAPFTAQYGPAASSLASSVPSQSGMLTTILPSIQKFAGIAQTVTPMVRQYYPLVKQLPALWKMLSAAPSQNEETLPEQSAANSTPSHSLKSTAEALPSESPSSAYFSEAPPPKLYV